MESLYYKGFEIYESIYKQLAGEKKSLVFGISDPQKAHLAAATPVPLLYLAATEEAALAATSEISSYGTETVYLFVMPDAEVKAIHATFWMEMGPEDDEEQEEAPATETKNSRGQSVGVGASFAFVYGKSGAAAYREGSRIVC